MPDLEAIGDAITGVALARTVESRAGEGDDGHTHERNCLNCGCALAGDFCHCCGQRGHVHRNLSAFWHDLLHGVLHFEGKIWRTLPLLALEPGELTRRYIRGERAKFVSPLALFLFSVFLMFAVFSLLGGPFGSVSSTPAEDRAEARKEFQEEQAKSREELADLDRELAKARAAGEPTSEIEGQRRAVLVGMAAQKSTFALAIRLAKEEEQREAKDAKQESDEPKFSIMDETGWAPLDRAVAEAEKNPSLLFYKIQNNAYKFSWALIPISLPFLWLLFLHRRRYRHDYGAYDHLIFITYSIAFMSLGAIALALMRPLGIGTAIIGSAFAFVPPIHMYRQLRGAYQLSRWSALWRTFVLLNFAFIALALFFVLLVALGVFG